MAYDYKKFEKVSLKSHPELDERWVQERIAEDPGILGLGDVILKDKERRQPRAGTLDLLLQDEESDQRYEVEVQLGPTDASHIIRTIEYWDIERKRYPQYDHTAVIVAEDITSRFFNVVGLFNNAIPLIAIQMNAITIDNQIGLVFTKVLDKLVRGPVDEDEETQEVADREYWESKSSKEILTMVDGLLELAKQYDNSLELKYNKNYIVTAKNGKKHDFFLVAPRKQHLYFRPSLKSSVVPTERLEGAGLVVKKRRQGHDEIVLRPGDIENNRELLAGLVKAAYDAASGE